MATKEIITFVQFKRGVRIVTSGAVSSETAFDPRLKKGVAISYPPHLAGGGMRITCVDGGAQNGKYVDVWGSNIVFTRGELVEDAAAKPDDGKSAKGKAA